MHMSITQIYSPLEKLPAAFTWADYKGNNYLTSIRNQHIPVYCGSCWAMGSTSSLADRWNVAQGPEKLPQIMLSVQNVLSCGNDETSCGTCNGGDDAPVYQYAKDFGIPHESCSNYMAVNTKCNNRMPVTEKNKPGCYTCSPGAKGCTAISEYDKLFVSNFGKCSGYEKMKQEIYNNGPISCGIDATDKMEAYTGGIYSEKGAESIDHIISVVGWGVDAQTADEYWIVRNSWGEPWGEKGFMRIVTSKNTGPAGTANNAIERECAFALVDRFAEA
mmetsp:Transcript_29017/g.79366  ORF Transcript_29017/g.79366 Transcript_29017/m.79366 type:complete len:275 (+) Transcript_29017:3-827(+)